MTIANHRIGLIVDHPQRDLPGLALLALALAGRGIETFLIPLYDQGIDVGLLDLDALVLNFARDVNLPLAKRYQEQGITLFVLDTEGGVMSESGRVSPSAIANYVANSEFSELLSGYFFWGDRLRDAFAATDALPQEKLHLTGCPRFDLYQDPLVSITEPRWQDHVLINTNFPLVNSRFTGKGEKAGDRAALEEVGQTPEYIDALFASNKAVLAGIIALVRRLASDLPEQKFVLRPHPFEDRAIYEREFQGTENVLVDGSGPVLNALRGARAIIHLNCSTAIEALLLGIPPLSPDWLNQDFLLRHSPLPTNASLRFDNYDDFTRALVETSGDKAGRLAALYDKAAYPFFHMNDGQSAQRVADKLAASVVGQTKGPTQSLTASLGGGRAKPSLAQRAQGLFANIVGSRAANTLRSRLQPARQAKRFSPVEVETLISQYAKCLGTPAPLVSTARHPLHRVPLSSIKVTPIMPLTGEQLAQP